MPRRTVYCRHRGCGHAIEVSEGKFPSYCSACGRGAKWNTEPLTDDPPVEPQPVEYVLTPKDKRLLWMFSISPD